MITISRFAEVDKSWDRFVESHAHGTVGHLSAWGTIAREAYGHECAYLVADDGGEIAGVLPLVRISSRLFGRRLVSMPFLDYGGVLADAGRGAETVLVDEALRLTRERGAHGLGLRQFHREPLPYPTTDDRVTALMGFASARAGELGAYRRGVADAVRGARAALATRRALSPDTRARLKEIRRLRPGLLARARRHLRERLI